MVARCATLRAVCDWGVCTHLNRAHVGTFGRRTALPRSYLDNNQLSSLPIGLFDDLKSSPVM